MLSSLVWTNSFSFISSYVEALKRSNNVHNISLYVLKSIVLALESRFNLRMAHQDTIDSDEPAVTGLKIVLYWEKPWSPLRFTYLQRIAHQRCYQATTSTS
jgi:hypothetical protein